MIFVLMILMVWFFILFSQMMMNTFLELSRLESCAVSYFVVEYRREFSPYIFYLCETRISRHWVNSVIIKLSFENLYHIEAVGFSGGIWVL